MGGFVSSRPRKPGRTTRQLQKEDGAAGTCINRMLQNEEDGRWRLAMDWQSGHGAVLALSVFPSDDKVITCHGDHTAIIWNMQTGLPVHTLAGHREAVMSARVFPAGDTVITGSYDGMAIIWNVATGEELKQLATGDANLVGGHHPGRHEPLYRVFAVAVFPDGKTVITGGEAAIVWDVAQAVQLLVFRRHRRPVCSIEVFPTGDKVVTSCPDHQTLIWNAETGELLQRLELNGEGRGPMPRFAVPFPRGDRVLISCALSPEVEIWDVAEETTTYLSSEDRLVGVLAAAIFPRGDKVVTSHGSTALVLWDVASGEVEDSFVSGDSTHFVKALAVSPLGDKVICGDWSGCVRIWQDSQAPGRGWLPWG